MKGRPFKCKDEVVFQSQIQFGNEKLIWDYGIVTYDDGDIVHLVGGLHISRIRFKILSYKNNEDLVGTEIMLDD